MLSAICANLEKFKILLSGKDKSLKLVLVKPSSQEEVYCCSDMTEIVLKVV